ncbi:MAG: hypothetical protein KDD47_03950 [Acidobacteria bacterium]|nr:hypothetical protein [Acidobacteriota bacterium]
MSRRNLRPERPGANPRGGVAIAVITLGFLTAVSNPSAWAQGGSEPIPAFDTGGLEARSAALILSGQKGGDLKASVLAVPLEGDAAEVRLAVVVDIEGGSLMEGQPEDEDDLITEVYAYALDESGGVGGFLTQAFLLDLAEYRPLLRRRGIKFLGSMKLLPGFYTLQVLVRQRRSERFNLQSVALAVERPEKQDSELMLPLFPEPPDRWLLVEKPTADGGIPLDRLPWSPDREGNVPSTFPVLRSDQPSSLFLLGEAAAGPLQGRIKNTRGEVVKEVGLDLGQSLAGPGGRQVRAVRVAPLALPPGQYFLEIERPEVPPMEGQGTKVGGKPAVIAGISVAVLPPEVGDELPTWAQLLNVEQTEEGTDSDETATLAAKHRSAGLARWWRAYREVLLDGRPGRDSKQAIRELSAMERSVLTGKGKRRTGEIQDEQLAAALTLARENPESLVPLLHFHEQQYERHHGKGQYLLATHSRQLSVRLAEAYLERVKSEGARRIVAANLVSLAGYLQQVGSEPSARRAFERALEYEPDNEAALLGLGANLEGYAGDYEGAEKVLRKLVEVRPRNVEGRLRLAVNLRRLGRREEAEQQLRQCLAPPAPRWVRAVAYQELADSLSAAGAAAEAVEVLREGIRELPDQQRLHIQLAATYDALGRAAAARQALENLDLRAGRDDDSPRFIYWRRPTWTIEASRRFLEESSATRLTVLADSLTAVDPGTEGGGDNAGK